MLLEITPVVATLPPPLLKVVLHHDYILHPRHHPPWLGICFRRSLWSVLRTPLHSAGKQSTKVNRSLTVNLFLSYPALCLIVRPYADSSELSYTKTLSYTTDTNLSGLGYASGDHSRGCYAPTSVWQESSQPRLTGLWPVVFFYCIRPTA